MTDLFSGKSDFNSDISNWNTSNVTNMYGMFDGASIQIKVLVVGM